MEENLVIIGNGFDLECGLKSSYSDFFNTRISKQVMESFYEIYEQFVSNKDEDFYSIYFVGSDEPNYSVYTLRDFLMDDQIDVVTEAKLTIWDLVFLFIGKSTELNWHNIEENIRLFLSHDIYEGTDYSHIGLSKGEWEGESSRIRFLCILSHELFDGTRYIGTKDIYDFLYRELRIFEESFVEYMINEVTKKKNIYDLKVNTLLQTILDPHYPDTNGCEFSVISFNYTRHLCMRGKITNIHGTLMDRNIIFGIDQKDVKSESAEYRFTKTFRKLTQVKRSQEAVTISGKETIRNIFFYGHSLSELDYSYFQSIFDYYDIYHSEITLVFCCTHFDTSKTVEEILQDQTIAASQLIESYGGTMGKEREHHGKNLLHKLMLEGRVDVRIIRPIY